jgi:DNA-binding transcriptional regulator LsrR (DeoR family)
VAGAVSRYLEDTLVDGDVLGLGWGRTTMEVMNVMSPAAPRRMEVVPILGESGYGGMYSQVNQMVLQFTRFYSARPYFLLAPMVLASRALRDQLLEENSIRRAAACWGRLTHAFVGIGALPSVEGHVLYLGEELVQRLMMAGAVGDITTRFFDQDGRFIQSELHDRVLGISLDQLARVKNVLAAACGVEKLQATLSALRTGLISDLFIDDELAQALENALISRAGAV